MIKINNLELSAAYLNGRPFVFFACNGVEYPIAKRSCYANGYWRDLYMWTDDTPWKD